MSVRMVVDLCSRCIIKYFFFFFPDNLSNMLRLGNLNLEYFMCHGDMAIQ